MQCDLFVKGVIRGGDCIHSNPPDAAAADDPSLGAPVEYIDLRGTSYDNPAVCKYTGEAVPARISPYVWYFN